MAGKGRSISTGLALAPLLGVGTLAWAADDAGAPVAPAPPAQSAPTTPTEPPSDLASEIGRLVGADVHGSVTTRYRARWTHGETDQDLDEYLNLRVGDESTDRVAGALFVRASEDLDPTGPHGRHTFTSLDDRFDSGLSAMLYTAYLNVRPQSGPLESWRVGRQYVYVSETYQLDGVSATTRPLVDSVKLKLTAFGGVPVHPYESSETGDWLAGLRASAEPWKGGRAALDYTHDQDHLSVFGREKNDLAALSLGQTIGTHVDVSGRFEWLDGPREASVRATASWPDDDLIVQGSYYRLLETRRDFATEYDPYFRVLRELVRYQQGDLRATKGFGSNFSVEAGASARQILPGAGTSAFNRDTRRVWLTPMLTDLPWQGTSLSVTGESLSGDGERLRTWAFDVSHRFSRTFKLSAGTDYSLYAFGPLGTDERSHVRTAYVRAKLALTKSLSADLRYTWEKDDVETFHVISLGLVLDF